MRLRLCALNRTVDCCFFCTSLISGSPSGSNARPVTKESLLNYLLKEITNALTNTHTKHMHPPLPTHAAPLVSDFSPKQGTRLTPCSVLLCPHSPGGLPHSCTPFGLDHASALSLRTWVTWGGVTCEPLQNSSLLYPSFGRQSAASTHTRWLVLSSVFNDLWPDAPEEKKANF